MDNWTNILGGCQLIAAISGPAQGSNAAARESAYNIIRASIRKELEAAGVRGDVAGEVIDSVVRRYTPTR